MTIPDFEMKVENNFLPEADLFLARKSKPFYEPKEVKDIIVYKDAIKEKPFSPLQLIGK